MIRLLFGRRVLFVVGLAAVVLSVACGGGGGSSGGGAAQPSPGGTLPTIPGVTPPVPASNFSDAGGGFTTVTASQSFLLYDVVVISGTVNYNGTYTIRNVTPTSFEIQAAFAGPEATGSVQKAGGALPGCSSTGATSVISLAGAPTRIVGVAPLSVFFDATSTTGGARPFHNLEYRWTFGDPAGSPVNGAAWNRGSRAGASSRNQATGPVAAHVFETPGVYGINLTVTDGTNTVTNACVQIAVQDPNIVFAGTRTTCFSTSGNFAGCPAGSNTVTTSSFVDVLAAASAGNSVRRLLLRASETFTMTGFTGITAQGPGVMASFGGAAGSRARITGTNVALLNISNPNTPTFSDWRFVDLELDGASSGTASIGVQGVGGADQVTLLRLNIHNTHIGLLFSAPILDTWNSGPNNGHHIWNELSFVDSIINTIGTVGQGGGGNGGFISATRFNYTGNLVQNSSNGEHLLRTPWVYKAVISNNEMRQPALPSHVLKLHAPNQTSLGVQGGETSREIVISDNVFQGGQLSVTLGPQDNAVASDQRVRDVVLERNWFVPDAATITELVIWARETTTRNNIFDMTGNVLSQGMLIGQRGPEPAPDQNYVWNNTFYSNSGGNFTAVILGAGTLATTIQNNLAAAPASASSVIRQGSASSLTESNNAVINTAGLFATEPPTGAVANFVPQAPNAAVINAGTTAPVHSDFVRAPRTPAGFDLGVYAQ